MKSIIISISTACVIFLVSCKEVAKPDRPIVNLIDVPSNVGSSLPFLYSKDDKMLMSWVSSVDDSLTALYYSQLNNDGWLEAQEITRDSDWFVNWADFPQIAQNNGHLLTHVLKKSSAGTYSYDVKLNLKAKGESSWHTDKNLHSDGTPTEHGFVSSLAYNEGFFVTWLDGRNTEEKEGQEQGAMSIRAAEVAVDGSITHETMLDASTCDCCQTTAAITDNGPVVLYRNRSDEEIRDINIVRNVEGEWTSPKTIYSDNWKIKGCPVNGPKAAVINNSLVVAWFTAAENQAKVKLTFSNDGGENFDEPILISENGAMGRVDVLLLNKETAIVSYMESTASGANLKTVKVNRNGELSKPMVIAGLGASRKTGFPQMEKLANRIYFAWTDLIDDTTSIKMASVMVSDF